MRVLNIRANKISIRGTDFYVTHLATCIPSSPYDELPQSKLRSSIQTGIFKV